MSLAVALGPQAAAADRRLRPRVLIIAEAAGDVGGIADELARRGHEVMQFRAPGQWRGADAFDAVIFAARAASDASVHEHCRRLAEAQGPMILVLQSRHDSAVASGILEAGADDCLAPPHNPREVTARVGALLRRRTRSARARSGRRWIFADCQLDSFSLVVRAADGRRVELTAVQHRLLTALLTRADEVVTRQELLDEVFGEDADCFDRAIDTHVSRLRRRLAQVSAAEVIVNCRGVGYRLQATPTAQADTHATRGDFD